MANCIECGNEFEGRTSKVYCSTRCRKRAENNRAKMNRIMAQLERLPEQTEEAINKGDFHAVRRARARGKQLQRQLSSLANKYDIPEAALWLGRLKALFKAP